MRVRGDRECRDCGARWSYFETASVACPECGSLRSRGIGDRERHTDAPAELDLGPVLAEIGEKPLEELLDDVKSRCRSYRRKRGFIRGGDLAPLDDAYVVAAELGQAADVFLRLRDPMDAERLYVTELLRGADTGRRPDSTDVPERLESARGLGVADSVLAYRSDIAAYLDDNPDPAARRLLGSLRDRAKWIEARQGRVTPHRVDAVLAAARDLGRYLITTDETALVSAQDRLAEVD